MNYPKETLAGMYGTDMPFLESVKAPVMGRKFNYIPALTMDPPRVLTDGINAYTRERRSDQGVMCDFPKSMTGGAINQLFEDGDLNDIVRGVNADYEFNQETLNAKFKPSDVYQFMRADAERYTDETIRDFFATKFEDKEEQKRDFMSDYGVSPADAEMILRKQRIDVAEAALKEFNSGRLPMRPKGTRVSRADLIAKNFMRNDVPMIEETDYFSPDGNLVPGITGISLGGGRRRVAGRRQVSVSVAAEETVRDDAIDGRPIIALSQAEREEKLSRLSSFAARLGEKKQTEAMQTIFSTLRGNLADRERMARERADVPGAIKKRVEKEFQTLGEAEGIPYFKKLTKEQARERLVNTERRLGVATGAGRPKGAGSK